MVVAAARALSLCAVTIIVVTLASGSSITFNVLPESPVRLSKWRIDTRIRLMGFQKSSVNRVFLKRFPAVVRYRHTSIFFLSGLGWHLPGLSEVPSWTPPSSITCWTVPAFLCFLHFFYTSSVFSFFSFLCFLIFVVPSLFYYTLRKARCQQLLMIFPKHTADTQPCDGPPSGLYHF